MGRRPPARDVLIALAVGVEMQAELFTVDGPQHDVLIARLAVLLLALAVLFRRSIPVLAAALALVGVALVESRGDAVSGNLAGPFFALLFVAFSIGANAEGRELVVAAGTLAGGSVVVVRLDDPPGGWDDIFFALTILTSGPLLVGRLVRARSRLNTALHEKALGAEHDRAARAAGAVAEERARIAGELHHLVSDALESMVGQAGAAERLARSKPDVAERAFVSVETTGREALSEIRRMLGVLRRDDEELALAPQPSLAHVRDLVARARAAGLPVELEVEGEAADAPGRRRPHRLSRHPGGPRRRAGGAGRAPRHGPAALRRRRGRARGDRCRRRAARPGAPAARRPRARRDLPRRGRRRASRRGRLRGPARLPVERVA